MPTLKIPQSRFFQLMGSNYQLEQLQKLGFQFGIQIEQDKQIKEDKEIKILKFDCMNNRPDLLTELTLTRTFQIYLGKKQTPQIYLSKPNVSIEIHPSVKQIRPFVVGAILNNIDFKPQTFKTFIQAQQKLHDTFCRARKYASIGTHDLNKVKPPFKYQAINPEQFKFIPLNQQKELNGLEMVKSLQNHKLKEYLHLIKDKPLYPVILDSNNQICSVPPIINSQYSKISLDTKAIFIEITALSRPKAMICLNTLIWSFSQYCSNKFEVQPVQIIDGEYKKISPEIGKRSFKLSHKNAQNMIGAQLTKQQVIAYLKRMGINALVQNEEIYTVKVPFWRSDVLHEADLLQDIAICYGYTKIIPTFPTCSTIGSRLRINKFADYLRFQLSQAQFNETLNFALCSKADLTSNIHNSNDKDLITISNAKTKQFQTGRNTLIPGILRTINENKSNPLPYKLFEVGDCILKDNSSDTGSCNVKKITVAMTDQILQGHHKDIFSIVHGCLDLIMKKCSFQFGKDYRLQPSTLELFFPGQQFSVNLKGQSIGYLGLIHPKVINNFGWIHPCAILELNIAPIENYFTTNSK